MAALNPADFAKRSPIQPGLVMEDSASLELLARLDRFAGCGAPVLITGETGTGKELLAREVHARSPRAERAFVAVNAGAFSEQLIESELFGHEKGAFTGAHERKLGWFEAANGGTLFLDEIGDLPLSSQVKLLRVLSTGEVARIGSRTPTRVDVRLVAATNVDLPAAIRERHFREDLYYRLNVTALQLPPLRDRPGDILPLAQHFLDRCLAMGAGDRVLRLGPDAAEALLRHDWPGNVRELENALQRAVVLCSTSEIAADDLGLTSAPRAIQAVATKVERSTVPADGEATTWAALEGAIEQLLDRGVPGLHGRVESLLMTAAFRHASNNQLETARLLGLSRHVTRARLIEHGQLPGAARRPGRHAVPAELLKPQVVRIGYQSLGLMTLVKAYGALDAALGPRALSISWQEYAGGIQIVDALRQGELEIGVVGDCPAVYAQAEGVPVVYVASEPPARHSAAVIVPRHSSLRWVRDLRGKRVAVNRAAQAHFLLMLALEEAGLDEDDIELSFEPPARALTAFRNGEIDAWAIWDPWLSSALLDLGARVLRDTSGLFDSSVYYLARQEFVETHPEFIAELCTQLQVAARSVESDPGRAANLVAKDLGISPRALAASFDRRLVSDGITETQLVAQQRIADQCLRLRLIPRPVSVAAAQWPRARSSAAPKLPPATRQAPRKTA